MRKIKYIKSIRLINFQSHKDNTIELAKGLNVIVGPSDSGKTAIIRAIIWVLFDEPLGDSIIRIGADEATVIITMYDGSYVKKSRKNRAVYEIYDSLTGKKEEYQGSKGDVKKKVANILGLRFSSDNEKDSYNIHDQLSPPFLISEGPAGKAQAIGKLVGIDILDEAVADTRKDIVQKKQAINASLVKKEELQETISNFDYLEDEKLLLFKIEENIKVSKSLISKLERLKTIQEDFLSTKDAIDTIKKTIENLKQILKGEEYIKELDSLTLKLQSFNSYLKLQGDISKQINENKEILEKSQVIIQNEEIVTELDKKNKRYSDLLKLLESVNDTKNKKKTQEETFNKLAFLEVIDLEEITNLNDKLVKVSSILQNKRKIEEDLRNKESIVAKLKKLDHVNEISNETNVLIDRYEKLKRFLDESKNNSLRIDKGRVYISNTKKEVENIAKIYAKELKNSGRCPTCLSEIDDIRVEKIVSELEV
ncbi:MAG: AAA family ATPase [Tissierellia bacterium]|nr:AAA family ATPase [Tissierellia bacterium]